MIALPVGRFLMQFGVESVSLHGVAEPDAHFEALQPLVSRNEEPQETLEAQIAAAREEGRREASAVAQEAFDAQLVELRADFEKRLTEARQTWMTEESDRLQAQLRDGFAGFETRLSEAVDAVLRPFLIETLRHQMISELVADINILIASADYPAIEISGSEAMLEILQRRLGEMPVSVEYRLEDSPDIRINAHNTIIESQLGAWIERFDPARE